MKKVTLLKKGLSAVLAGTMVLGLAACGSGSGGDSKDEGGDKSVTLKWQQWNVRKATCRTLWTSTKKRLASRSNC